MHRLPEPDFLKLKYRRAQPETSNSRKASDDLEIHN
jgi:hypothetical protein